MRFVSPLFALSCLTAMTCGLPMQPASLRGDEVNTYNRPQVARLNEEIRAVWADWEITPSGMAADGEWCRRVHLDIIGRIPSVKELTTFQQDKDPDKKAKLVDRLLHEEEYVEEYARNWTTLWTNVLIGRSGGTERNTLTSREGMQKYLRDTFARNKPYDKMVHELVTATGTTAPGSEKFNGATNFLAMKVNEEKGTLATAATTKVFMGLQVQCTQCHNHPFNEWKQQKFWEMNAFFRQTRALRTFEPGTRNVASAELVNEDWGGEGSTPEEAELYFEQRNGLLNAAYPVFVDGTEVNKSGFVEDVVRRDALSKLMLRADNKEEANYVEKMIVNRMWGHFFGYAFTKPVDDLGPHNSPTHPVLLNYLGLQLRENSYDLKELITWITLSEAYNLSSRTNSTNITVDDPQLGEDPKFSRFYMRQMRAEELYESLLVATQAHKSRGGSYADQEKVKTEWLRQFTVAFGNDEGEEQTTFNGTIPQALMMFNGDLVKKATSSEKGSFLSQLGASKLSNPQKIDYLFRAALSRKANSAETRIANQLMLARKGDPVAALQDVWWAVLNSNEFIINH